MNEQSNAIPPNLNYKQTKEPLLHIWEPNLFGLCELPSNPTLRNIWDTAALVVSVKACTQQKDLYKGSFLHAYIQKFGVLQIDLHVGTSLINMYAKCGALGKAELIFHELLEPDVISWNTLITGYIKNGHNHKALECFNEMQCQGLLPNAVTFTCMLKACGSIGLADKGEEIHAVIARQGLLSKDSFIGNALVDMYAKCGALVKAQEAFDALRQHDVISWSTLITGYSQNGYDEVALICFDCMKLEGLSPNAVTFIAIIKACSLGEALKNGETIHKEVTRLNLMKEIPLGNALVDMYGNCGALEKAQDVFHQLSLRDIGTWNTMLAVFVQHLCWCEALNLYEQMLHHSECPNAVTMTCVLKACGNIGAIEKGKKFHACIVHQQFLAINGIVGNVVVDMYAKCGALVRAQEVFNGLPVPDIFAWSALISGYAQHGHDQDVLNCYERMRHQGLCPDSHTYICIMKACASLGTVEKGEEIHNMVIKDGLLERETVIGNALVDMYAKCGRLAKAEEIFNKFPHLSVVAWSALIAGYIQHGQSLEALNCFGQMRQQGLSPDAVTFTCILKACSCLEALDLGKEIHVEIVQHGLLGKDPLVGDALVNMYAKCGNLAKAQEVFDELPIQNMVTWTTLILGLVMDDHDQEALNYFDLMQHAGFRPDAVTFTCILKAYGSLGALGKGEAIHAELCMKGLVQTSMLLGCSMVDMYAKCGEITKAAHVFDDLPVCEAISWNMLIAGYSRIGSTENVFKLFSDMVGLVDPDHVTFVALLNACSHLGLVEEGQTYFESMTMHYGVAPTLEHETCMVDLFSRTQLFEKAVQVIGNVQPVKSSDIAPLLSVLLGSCQKWGNVELGRLAFQHLLEFDAEDAATYVCMRNIYASSSLQVARG